MAHTAKHIIFTGRVQGVGFRFTAHRLAGQHRLTGWVRNLPDGSVEMFAQGPEEDIDACIEEIRQSFSGYVRDTDIRQTAPEPRFTNFRITF